MRLSFRNIGATFSLIASAVALPAQAHDQHKEFPFTVEDFETKYEKQPCLEEEKRDLCGTARGLNKNERQTFGYYFGDVVGLNNFTISYEGWHQYKIAQYNNKTQTVSFLGEENYLHDYSLGFYDEAFRERLKEDEDFYINVFSMIHEYAHHLQNQSGLKYSKFLIPELTGDNEYEFKIKQVAPFTSFTTYGSEQQAEMMVNYFALVYLGEDYLEETFINKADPNARDLLVTLVEDTIPTLKQRRLEFERQQLLAARPQSKTSAILSASRN